ncbi:MAG: succinylglutamate desuccinylase/aspartoacylase family protein [Solirubrobacteraceae bacterium]
MIERRTVTSANPTLAGLSWPVFEATGERDGPRLTLLAGIHGAEYPAIAAVRAFMRELDTSALAGSILAVPIASPTSFRVRSAFVVPEDGRNLNRAFPGRADGSFSDALADHLFQEFIAGSGLLVDLHGGDLFEALEPFTIYEDSPQRETAHRLACAFNFPYVIRERGGDLRGMTSAAAADAGIPAVIAEAGGCGLLEPGAVQRHLDGLHNALRAAGMLAGPVIAPPAGQRLVEDFRWLRCANAGWWQSEVEVGATVVSGKRLGAILDPFGDDLEEIAAPLAGAVVFLTTSPAVDSDGLLMAIGGALGPVGQG